ncbi:protein of unknown function [Georgfuchsia toluolica]|uniref:Uncharacterized protein n=1 Tax=Georgfuchsia toluolica TaxID=424218 RepID=A0A916J611_9PROT|nr:protein of unknown function [Georgfuchsia toluolica]
MRSSIERLWLNPAWLPGEEEEVVSVLPLGDSDVLRDGVRTDQLPTFALRTKPPSE